MLSEKRKDLIRLLGKKFGNTDIKSGTDDTVPIQSRLAPYRAWETMKASCNNKTHIGYASCGARGISYTSNWEIFETFWNDTKHGWVKGARLFRKDDTKGFAPSNCYWQPPDDRPVLERAKCASGVWGLLLWSRNPEDPNKSWRVRLTDPETGKRVSKMWSVKRYGDVYAFMLARQYLYELQYPPAPPAPEPIDPAFKPF